MRSSFSSASPLGDILENSLDVNIKVPRKSLFQFIPSIQRYEFQSDDYSITNEEEISEHYIASCPAFGIKAKDAGEGAKY